MIKFAGCYHGHADALLADAGSGLATLGIPSTGGADRRDRGHDRRAFNDVDAAAAAVERYREGLAAIVVEPVAGNMGVVPPEPGSSRRCARSPTRRRAARLRRGDDRLPRRPRRRAGALRRDADLTMLGKIVGGGLPLAAFGGRADVMDALAPAGAVYQAGTLSGNPLATAAALVVLRRLVTRPCTSGSMRSGPPRAALLGAARGRARLQRVGSMLTLFFNPGPVRRFADASASDADRFAAFFRHMLEAAVYLAPSQFEAWFVSTAHGEEEIGGDGAEAAARSSARS